MSSENRTEQLWSNFQEAQQRPNVATPNELVTMMRAWQEVAFDCSPSSLYWTGSLAVASQVLLSLEGLIGNGRISNQAAVEMAANPIRVIARAEIDS